MAKTTDFEKELPKMEKRVKELADGVKKLDTMQDKKYSEFQTLNGALHEGKKVIEGNQKDLKKEKDTKKIKELAEEIEEEEKTFDKISKKLATIVKELGEMGTTAANLTRSLTEEQKELDAMDKDLLRTGGDVKELKEYAATIKELRKVISNAKEKVDPIADTPKSLPKTPKL